MSTPMPPDSLRAARKSAVEDALRDGYGPLGASSGTKGSAVIEAARRLGVNHASLSNWARLEQRLEAAGQPPAGPDLSGNARERHYAPDWSLYQAPTVKPRVTVTAEHQRAGKGVDEIVEELQEPLGDSERLRYIEREKTLRNRVRELEREMALRDELRQGVFNLAKSNIIPPKWSPEIETPRHSPGVPMFWLTDIHTGENVDSAEMDGLNAYSPEIFQRRLRAYFANALNLLFAHQANPVYSGCYLLIGGDTISGIIHEELLRTNDLEDHPAVCLFVQEAIRGIEVLLAHFPEVVVIGVPGNHGRTPRKPAAKLYATLSYDTLALWMIERWFAARGETRASFHYPRTGDAVWECCGRTFVLTHGDMIGSKGGQGFVGPEATILRGAQKVRRQYSGWGVILDYVLTGHFHVHREMGRSLSAGALIGWNEYARRVLRAEYEPPSQPLVLVHPKVGVVNHTRVEVDESDAPDDWTFFDSKIGPNAF